MPTTPQRKIAYYINRIVKILGEEQQILSQNYWLSEQKKIDIKRGVFRRRSGILIPIDVAEYRVLYEGYHINVLESFILLIKEVMKYRKISITNFSLRSLWEIGFTRIDVYFSKDVDPIKEKRARLLSVLVDYAIKKPLFFKKLFRSEKSILKQEEINIINNYLVLPASVSVKEERFKIIKELRRKVGMAYSEAYQSITPYPFLANLNLNNKIIPSHLSHFLHGDPYLIKGLMETKTTEQEKRVFAIIIRSGLNAVNRIGEFINDSKIMNRITKLNSELSAIWKILLSIKS